MEENNNLERSKGSKHQILIESLLFLTKLKQHQLAVPVHENEKQKAQRVQNWHSSRIKQSYPNSCQDLRLDNTRIKHGSSVKLLQSLLSDLSRWCQVWVCLSDLGGISLFEQTNLIASVLEPLPLYPVVRQKVPQNLRSEQLHHGKTKSWANWSVPHGVEWRVIELLLNVKDENNSQVNEPCREDKQHPDSRLVVWTFELLVLSRSVQNRQSNDSVNQHHNDRWSECCWLQIDLNLQPLFAERSIYAE